MANGFTSDKTARIRARLFQSKRQIELRLAADIDKLCSSYAVHRTDDNYILTRYGTEVFRSSDLYTFNQHMALLGLWRVTNDNPRRNSPAGSRTS